MKTLRRVAGCRLLPLLSEVFLILTACALLTNGYAAHTDSVNVRRVVIVGRLDEKFLYSVDVDLLFSDRHAVYIPGIGTVDSKSSLEFVTNSNALDVYDRQHGRRLVTVTLKPNAEQLGADFQTDDWGLRKYDSTSGDPSRWRGTGEFSNHALKVLGDMFGAPRVFSQDACEYYWTRPKRISVTKDQKLMVEIAVQVKHCERKMETDTFEVDYSALERRTGTDWSNNLSPVSRDEIWTFIASLKSLLEK